MSTQRQGRALYLELQDLRQLQDTRAALFHWRIQRLLCAWVVLVLLAFGCELGMYKVFPPKPDGEYLLCNLRIAEHYVAGCARVKIVETSLSKLRWGEPVAFFRRPPAHAWDLEYERHRYRRDRNGPVWAGAYLATWHRHARLVLLGLWSLVSLMLFWLVSRHALCLWRERGMKRPMETELLRMKNTSVAYGGLSVAVEGDELRGSLTESSQGGLEVVEPR